VARQFSYESRGVPLEGYELTRSDHSRQRTSEQIAVAVAKMGAAMRAEEAADPALRERRLAQIRHVWQTFLSTPTPARELMRWRVRLYCGHIVETRRHYTFAKPTEAGSSSMRCPDCDRGPASIVAFEPVGLVEPQNVPAAAAPQARRPSRVELERRIRDLEAQLAAAGDD
jgi:hypothetical protein